MIPAIIRAPLHLTWRYRIYVRLKRQKYLEMINYFISDYLVFSRHVSRYALLHCRIIELQNSRLILNYK